MTKVKCYYCGKWTDKYYSCQLPDYDGEGYCCEDCQEKIEFFDDGPGDGAFKDQADLEHYLF